VLQQFKDEFNLGFKSQFGGELRGGEGLAGGRAQGEEHFLLRGEDAGGGLFAGFDSRLVVGVDAHEAAIEADGAFEEGDDLADGDGGDFGQSNRDGLATLLEERLARAEEEALQEVAAGGVRLDVNDGAGAVLEHFDEDREEVEHAVAQLLDVGVLVGGAFVAVNGNALVDGLAREVEFLAEGFHDELLQIAGEQEQAVLVREDDHVLRAAAIGEEIPRQRHEGRRVFLERAQARDGVHRFRAGEEAADVHALQSSGQESDGAELGGAAAHPVPHREAGEEVVFDGVLVEVAAVPGGDDRVAPKVQAGALVGGFAFDHAVAGLGRAAGLRGDDGQGAAQLALKLPENEVNAVGVGVVDEVDGELVAAGLGERVGDEFGAEGGAADADAEDVFEGAGGAFDFALVHLGGEVLDALDGGFDVVADGGGGREAGVAEPVVADHAVFVGVGDGAFFEGVHGVHGGGHLGPHFFQEVVGKGDATDIHGDAEFFKRQVKFLETVPAHGANSG